EKAYGRVKKDEQHWNRLRSLRYHFLSRRPRFSDRVRRQSRR
ncbi:proteasome component C1, partial [Corchorus capsularis]